MWNISRRKMALDRHPQAQAKQQLLVVQRGSVGASVRTGEGEHLGDGVLREDAMILSCEGHAVEFLEPDTRVIQIRMGPHAGGGKETRPLYGPPRAWNGRG